VAGAASAQTPFGRPTPAGQVQPADPFFGGLNPGFQFNPAFPPNGNGFPNNFGPGSQFANPFTQGLLGASAFANPQTNPLVNANLLNQQLGTGFVNGFNGFNTLNGFNGTIGAFDPFLGGTALVNPFQPVGTPFGVTGGFGVGVLPGPAQLAAPPPASYTTARLPLLGINSSAHTVAGLPPNMFANRPVGYRARSYPSVSHAAKSEPSDTRVALHMEQIMRSRPIAPGHVTKIGATGIVVKLDDSSATRRYDLSEVFFYKNDRLMDASTSTANLHKGDAVLVPDSSRIVS